MLLILLVLVGAAGAVWSLGDLRWRRRAGKLAAQLEAARQPGEPRCYDERELGGLPAPVQRYFKTVLVDGQGIVTAVRLEQAGTMNLNEASPRWKSFTAEQRIVTRRPGFVWDARLSFWPGVTVRVHDAYIGGEGVLEAAVFGLMPMARQRGAGEVARAELLRYLAEAAWYPTALLPSQGVAWAAIDDRTARASLRDGDDSVTLLFRFGADGLIDRFRADARARMIGGVMDSAPWEGRFWNYSVSNGLRIPMSGEVAWILPSGSKPYWRGEVVRLAYELAA